MKLAWLGVLGTLMMAAASSAETVRGHLETDDLPAYLRDRGTGIPLSQFGTYIQKRQFVVYPFFEYYYDHNGEYAPNELGFGLDEDFRAKYTAYEGLLFLAYGVSDRLAIEFEAAYIDARQETSPEDPTNIPPVIEESGLGDVEGQLRWRWRKENPESSEIFSYFETVFPTAEDNSLIGTTGWEFKLGTGAIRGWSWGTMTFRGAVEFVPDEAQWFDIGEVAVEYLRRLSPHWRFYGAIEGTQDEVEGIPELQWHPTRRVIVKLNSAFGITPKATDWAPEVGILFSF
jgi:hypothetical protein